MSDNKSKEFFDLNRNEPQHVDLDFVGDYFESNSTDGDDNNAYFTNQKVVTAEEVFKMLTNEVEKICNVTKVSESKIS